MTMKPNGITSHALFSVSFICFLESSPYKQVFLVYLYSSYLSYHFFPLINPKNQRIINNIMTIAERLYNTSNAVVLLIILCHPLILVIIFLSLFVFLICKSRSKLIDPISFSVTNYCYEIRLYLQDI